MGKRGETSLTLLQGKRSEYKGGEKKSKENMGKRNLERLT